MRLHERRRENCAGPPPHLPTAMRQLRMQVIDAHGDGAREFAQRAQALASLAQHIEEQDVADTLSALAMTAARGQERDLRAFLYQGLDHAHAALRMVH